MTTNTKMLHKFELHIAHPHRICNDHARCPK